MEEIPQYYFRMAESASCRWTYFLTQQHVCLRLLTGATFTYSSTYELLTHFGSNPPIHMLVVYKLSWKRKKMCMKKNKRVPSVSVPQRNAFTFERSCCSTQHPDVWFCVVMTVLEDSFRLGRQRKKATWILPCSKSRLLNTLLLLVS